MIRDHIVLSMLGMPAPPPLCQVAVGLYNAVKECEHEQTDPETDPAVLLYGVLVAFGTHADVNSVGGYQRLVQMCEARTETSRVH